MDKLNFREREIDAERIENLKKSLSVQLLALGNARTKEDYISMSEIASNIEKMSYTISFLKGQIKENG